MLKCGRPPSRPLPWLVRTLWGPLSSAACVGVCERAGVRRGGGFAHCRKPPGCCLLRLSAPCLPVSLSPCLLPVSLSLSLSLCMCLPLCPSIPLVLLWLTPASYQSPNAWAPAWPPPYCFRVLWGLCLLLFSPFPSFPALPSLCYSPSTSVFP